MREKEFKLNLLLLGVVVLCIIGIFFLAFNTNNTIKSINSEKEIIRTIKEISYCNPITDFAVNDFISHSKENRLLALTFYQKEAGSYIVAEAIIDNAIKHEVPVNLAFALAFTESSYNPNSINGNTDRTQDKGLFQLNTRTFSSLTNEQFFDPNFNADKGLEYLRNRFNTVEYWEEAVSRYNAHNSPNNNTVRYIGRINYHIDRINKEFYNFQISNNICRE